MKKINNACCNVISFPYNTTKEEILKYKPNGLFVSNGPGNPEALPEVIELIKSFIGVLPIFGVALGHQLVALAYGAKAVKMKYGHHGVNYPVRNMLTGKVEITGQNHLYTLDKTSIKGLTITHENVIDGDVEGLKDEKNNVMTVQFEPGVLLDENSEDVFRDFLSLMKKCGGKKNA